MLFHSPTLPAFYTLYVRVVLCKGGGRTGRASSGSTAWVMRFIPLLCFSPLPPIDWHRRLGIDERDAVPGSFCFEAAKLPNHGSATVAVPAAPSLGPLISIVPAAHRPGNPRKNDNGRHKGRSAFPELLFAVGRRRNLRHTAVIIQSPP